MRLLAVPVLAVAASLAFGPPRVRVSEVTGTPPTPGAVLALVTEHHTEEEDAQVTAEATTLRNGERSTRTLRIDKAARAGHYGVARQWDAGTPWVLVFTIKQGPNGAHGTASAVVKVDAAGKVRGIDELIDRIDGPHRIPRGATKADIERALRELGAN